MGTELMQSVPIDRLRFLEILLDRHEFFLQVLNLGMVVIQNLQETWLVYL